MGLWHTGLRYFVGPPLMLAGVSVVVLGVRGVAAALRTPATEPAKNLRLMASLRRTIVGLAVVTTAAGWLLLAPVLVVLGAVIGLGELLETSIDVWALRQQAEYLRRKRREDQVSER